MGEKKEIKVKFSTVICIILIILLIAGCGLLYYFGFIQKGKEISKLKSEKNSIEKTEKDLLNKISVLDEDIKLKQQEIDKLISNKNENNLSNLNKDNDAIIGKGYGQPLVGEGYIKDGYLYYSNDSSKEPRKIEGVSNIKSLNIYNIGTGMNKVPFVVTEDGIVYRLNGAEELVVFEELSDYKVDKIISCEGELTETFTLLLLDGTTKVVNISYE